jgi:hypothetical protein
VYNFPARQHLFAFKPDGGLSSDTAATFGWDIQGCSVPVFSVDSRSFFTSIQDGSIYEVSLESGEILNTFGTGTLQGELSISSDGHILASVRYGESKIDFWRI